MFRLVSGNLERWVWVRTLKVYKVSTKTGQGPWLRGDWLGPAGVISKLPSTICIVVLSEQFPGSRGYNKVKEARKRGEKERRA